MSTDQEPAEMRMANDIVRQFVHLSPEERSARLAQHVRTFWEPRMHERLRIQVAGAGDACDPVVAAAAAQLPI